MENEIQSTNLVIYNGIGNPLVWNKKKRRRNKLIQTRDSNIQDFECITNYWAEELEWGGGLLSCNISDLHMKIIREETYKYSSITVING